MIGDSYTPTRTIGNGSTQDFAFTFPIFASTNIRVYLEDKDTAVQTLQTVTAQFTITFDDATPGGSIHFVSAPSSQYYVVIEREIPRTQDVDYKTSSGFDGAVLQSSLDKLTAMIQDLAQRISNLE